jgi:hypothetical protein
MKQQDDNPALDPFRSVFVNGGAALMRIVSAGKDPWSDARLAIGQFASKLVKACSRQATAADTSSH